MKKGVKILLMGLSLVLVAAIAVGATMAYLTDSTDTVKNTFTVGKVDITLDEAVVERTENDTFVATNERTTEGNEYLRIYPGVDIPKDPTVTVKAGSEKAYVAVELTVNKGLTLLKLAAGIPADQTVGYGDILRALTDPNNNSGLNPAEFFHGDWQDSTEMINGTVTGWKVAGAKIDGEDLSLLFVHIDTAENVIAPVDASGANDVVLDPVIDGIKVPGSLTNEQLNSLDNMEITVTAYAIQANGFESESELRETAIAAFSLNDYIFLA